MANLVITIHSRYYLWRQMEKYPNLKKNHTYSFSAYARVEGNKFQRIYKEFQIPEGDLVEVTLVADGESWDEFPHADVPEDRVVWGQQLSLVRSPYIQCDRPENEPPMTPEPSETIGNPDSYTWPPGFRHENHTVKEMVDDLYTQIDYVGPLSLADRLQSIADNDDSPELLIHGDGKGWKCWKHLVGNGYRLSVQGSRNTKCEPEFSDGPYTHLEVADMREGDRDLIPGWEKFNSYDNIYSKVPVEEIQKILGIQE